MNKKQFRQNALLRLRDQRYSTSYIKDKYINNELYKLIREQKVKNIMLYIPLGLEVNIMPLIKRMRIQKRELFVPFMEGESFRLVKYRLPLIIKKFGIREPKHSKQYRKKKIDLSIVPMVGTDVTLRRIGFGKGIYDRFFERERKNIKRVVFISRVLIFSKQIVTDHYDVRADMIITPEKILTKEKRVF